jgi:HSP20 family protein
MTLIKWNPLRDVTAWHPATDFTNVHREIDRMFDRFRGGAVDDNGTSTWLPAVDIAENANGYVVNVKLPGVDKKDVKITLQNDVLTVRGEKKQESEKTGENYRRVERAYGIFQRSFTLPSSVKNSQIEAAYDNGVLTISLPKAEEAKPKEIEVKVK